MTRFGLASAAVAAALSLFGGVAAGPAQAGGRYVTETASGGAVVAQLSYKRSRSRLLGVRFSNLSLRIERGGATLLSGPVAPPCDGCDPVPAGAALGKRTS